MVKFALQIKATLDNIEVLKPATVDFKNPRKGEACIEDNFRWYLKFTCNNCREEFEKVNYVSLDEHHPSANNSNSVNHFSSKCKFCSRENSLTIIKDSITKYTAADSDKFKTIVCFDCRGITPINCLLKEGWIVKASNDGKEFKDVDLSDGEWVEYCDITNKAVGIYDIECNFEKVK